MKFTATLSLTIIILTGFAPKQGDNVDFSCLKKNKASNTCHFNFVVDGARYRFVDIGCRFEKKKEDVIKKAKEGNLALAKDWKIECPVAKTEKEKQAPAGF
jgi:hypothetical protein